MKIAKAYAISDAKISFMSLVNKAANKREFLITKAEDGTASFTSIGRILKADNDTHYVTGVAYEPMVEDAHGNYMTEEEIKKAAYWFAKNGDKVDIQHSFEKKDGASVVENWVTKSEETINGETVAKGTWLVTVEVTDDSIWEQIEKGQITGFSMGGVGKYSTVDVDIKNGGVAKMDDNSEKLGLFKKLAKAFGFDMVEKTEDEPEKPLLKAGKKMSGSNKKKLDEICESLATFSKEFNEIEEDEDMKAEDIQKMISDEIKKAMPKETEPQIEDSGEITKEMVQKMISDEIKKCLQTDQPQENPPTENPAPSSDEIQKMITKAVSEAIEPVLKARGLPSNLNDSGDPVEKSEQHFLHGIL